MKTLYKNAIQRQTALDVTRILLNYTKETGRIISKETLNVICDRYCYVTDPPDESGTDDKYHEEKDPFEVELEKIKAKYK